ncbi:MAG TPA: YggS family pyridoxal phosphate-dependent enzyme [Candidatus Nanopelagicaceae bacterium]
MALISRSLEIAQALHQVQERVVKAANAAGREAEEITLIAVTKTYPVSDVEILRDLGVKNFGENRDNEGAEKSHGVPGTWHFQGQIQSNKIHSISRWADVVHSLDNVRHALLLNRAIALEKKMSVFIQVSLDNSVGRGGATPSELAPLAESILTCGNLRLEGLMAVAPLDEDPESAFARLALIHSDFRRQFPDSSALSAGMSQDFESAIAHGATHVRIGSSILGSRTSPL